SWRRLIAMVREKPAAPSKRPTWTVAIPPAAMRSCTTYRPTRRPRELLGSDIAPLQPSAVRAVGRASSADLRRSYHTMPEPLFSCAEGDYFCPPPRGRGRLYSPSRETSVRREIPSG